MADGPPDDRETRIRQYKNSIVNAAHLFKAALARNDCSAADITNFEILTILGKGGYGEVYKARNNSRLFAIKKQTKARFRPNKQNRVIREKMYLYAAKGNPFIVELFFKSKDLLNLYLVMEYTPYGDLQRLKAGEGPFPETKAVKILAQIVMALEYLHACNVVYRDLKPSNVLVFAGGRLKLADFGAIYPSKTGDDTLLGSCSYMSPEMIESGIFTAAGDWWALGINMFELLLNEYAFGSFKDARTVRWSRILSDDIVGLDESRLSREAKDLISQLLEKDMTQRIGARGRGALDIKNHPWFSEVNFEDLIVSREIFPIGPQYNTEAGQEEAPANVFKNIGDDVDDPNRTDFADF